MTVAAAVRQNSQFDIKQTTEFFRMRATAVLLAILTFGTPVFAHTGISDHAHSAFTDGFAHPYAGLDHLLTMVGVGLWAALVGDKARWVWPLAFVAVMAAGGAMGIGGVAMPYAEIMILGSLIVIGAAVACGWRAPLVAGAMICAAFAVAHGHAHGTELPAGTSALGYATGFLLATASLHGAGMALGLRLQRSSILVRAAGTAIAATGAMLAFA